MQKICFFYAQNLHKRKIFCTFAHYLNSNRQTMKRLCIFLSAIIAFLGVAFAAVPSYTNPILPYDYSDPDVCRVGDTYLMTSSSFTYSRGALFWQRRRMACIRSPSSSMLKGLVM